MRLDFDGGSGYQIKPVKTEKPAQAEPPKATEKPAQAEPAKAVEPKNKPMSAKDIPTDTLKAYNLTKSNKPEKKTDVPVTNGADPKAAQTASNRTSNGPTVVILDDFSNQHDDHGRKVANSLEANGVKPDQMVGYQSSGTKDIPPGEPLPANATAEQKKQYYDKRATQVSTTLLDKQAQDIKDISGKVKPGSVINSSTGFSKTSVAETIISEQGITDPKDAQAVYDSVNNAVDNNPEIKTAKTKYEEAVNGAKDKGVSVVVSAGNDQQKVEKGALVGPNGKPIEGLKLSQDGAVNQFSTPKNVVSVGALDKGADGQAGTADDRVESYSAGNGQSQPDVLAASADGREGTSYSTAPVVAQLLGNTGTEQQQVSQLSGNPKNGIVAANGQQRDTGTVLDASGNPLVAYDGESGDAPKPFGPEGMADKSYDDWRTAGNEAINTKEMKALLGVDENAEVPASSGTYIAAAVKDAVKNNDKNDLVTITRNDDGTVKQIILKNQPGVTLWNAAEATQRLSKEANGDKEAYTRSQDDVAADGSVDAAIPKIKMVDPNDPTKTTDITDPNMTHDGDQFDITGLLSKEDLAKIAPKPEQAPAAPETPAAPTTVTATALSDQNSNERAAIDLILQSNGGGISDFSDKGTTGSIIKMNVKSSDPKTQEQITRIADNIKSLSGLDGHPTDNLNRGEAGLISQYMQQGYTLDDLITIGNNRGKTKDPGVLANGGKPIKPDGTGTVNWVDPNTGGLIDARESTTPVTINFNGNADGEVSGKKGNVAIVQARDGGSIKLDPNRTWTNNTPATGATTQVYKDDKGNQVIVHGKDVKIEAKGAQATAPATPTTYSTVTLSQGKPTGDTTKIDPKVIAGLNDAPHQWGSPSDEHAQALYPQVKNIANSTAAYVKTNTAGEVTDIYYQDANGKIIEHITHNLVDNIHAPWSSTKDGVGKPKTEVIL